MPRLLRASSYTAGRLPWRLQQCVLPTNRLRRHSIKPHFRACVRWVGSSTSAALPSSVRLPLRCAVSRRRRWRCGRFPGTIGRQDYSCRVDGAACVSALWRSTFRLYHTAIARNGYCSQRHYQPALVQYSLAGFGAVSSSSTASQNRNNNNTGTISPFSATLYFASCFSSMSLLLHVL